MISAQTEADVTALEELKSKHKLIAWNVRQLVHKVRTSFFLWGDGGLGKTYTVRKTLDDDGLKEGKDYVYYNSKISAAGLYDRLNEHKEALVWIEDTETLFSDRDALGIIRSATGTQEGPRVVNRNVRGQHTDRFEFRGSLLVLSNRDLGKSPELEAVRSRMRNLEFNPSPAEIVAKMKEMCLVPFRREGESISPDECREVLSFLLLPCFSDVRLSLRDLENGCADYLFWKHHDQSVSWQQALKSHLEHRVLIKPKTRDQQNANKERIAVEVRALGLHCDESIERYRARTGEGKDSYYEAIKRVRTKSESQNDDGAPTAA